MFLFLIFSFVFYILAFFVVFVFRLFFDLFCVFMFLLFYFIVSIFRLFSDLFLCLYIFLLASADFIVLLCFSMLFSLLKATRPFWSKSIISHYYLLCKLYDELDTRLAPCMIFTFLEVRFLLN